MGTQDFAHVEVPQTEDAPPPLYTKGMLLSIASVVIVLGSFVGGFWLGQKRGIEVASGEDKARLEKILHKQESELVKLREIAAIKAKPKVSTTQVGELTFYNELPKQSAQPTPLHGQSNVLSKQASVIAHAQSDDTHKEAVRKMIEKELQQSMREEELQQSRKEVVQPIASKSTASATTGFMLQVASFQKKNDADTFASKLKAKGFESTVKRVKLNNLGIWYRIYMDGFATRKDANTERVRLEKMMKVKALVVKSGG